MLSISPIKLNTEYKSKINAQPSFTSNFKMLTCAYDSTKEYFKGQKFLPKITISIKVLSTLQEMHLKYIKISD